MVLLSSTCGRWKTKYEGYTYPMCSICRVGTWTAGVSIFSSFLVLVLAHMVSTSVLERSSSRLFFVILWIENNSLKIVRIQFHQVLQFRQGFSIMLGSYSGITRQTFVSWKSSCWQHLPAWIFNQFSLWRHCLTLRYIVLRLNSYCCSYWLLHCLLSYSWYCWWDFLLFSPYREIVVQPVLKDWKGSE